MLSGTVDRLGSANLFTAMILNMDGSLVENGDEEYQNITDGLEKMSSLSHKLTSIKSTARSSREHTAFFKSFIPTDFSFGLHANFGITSFKNSEYMDVEFDNGFTFVPGVYASLGFLRNMIALQPELLFIDNYAGYKDKSGASLSFNSKSLLVPVMLRLNFCPGRFLISGLGGVYFSVPLEDMAYDGNKVVYYKYDTPLGWMAGINLGFCFKSNLSLYTDFRYGAEIGNTSISDGKGWLEIYQRSVMLFGIGIEYRIEFK